MVALVGRPNVGKSTLLNHLAGEKVAIVTQVPGTTRSAVRAVLTRAGAQLVLVDTPGVGKPRTAMGQRMNRLVRDVWSGVDAVAFLVDAAAGVGAGDAYLAEELRRAGAPVVTVVTKIDLLRRPEDLLPVLARIGELTDGAPFAEVVPVSAVAGENTARLEEVLVAHLPEAPRLFPTGRVSDQPAEALAAEVVREKVMADLADELPHSVAVTVDAVSPDEHADDLVHIEAVIHVERDSQKGIVIGRGGERLKAAGTAARLELEALLGVRVHLATRVKVAPGWQDDPRQLGRLGL